MKKSLVIVEVSQKQAYIFSSNKLKDNIRNSAVIAHVTGARFFEEAAKDFFEKEKNEVYCGGGHAILQFDEREAAKKFIRQITLHVKKHFPGLELFATILDCDGNLNADRIKDLIQKLERKKSKRRASFFQGSFGVEEVDSTSRDIKPAVPELSGSVRSEQTFVFEDDGDMYPEGYERAFDFENLGGTKNESNFVAVVHIDGNAMGKRVEAISEQYGNMEWDLYCKKIKEFSESIASDFKETFTETCDAVEKNIQNGRLGDIVLKLHKNGKPYFPIRRIITEGDDICFVTEGRIGLECARIFMEKLYQKTNAVDHQLYSAAAGVAIVHQKYPFYMAYELAERLCTNAKKYIANASKDLEGVDASGVSAIDWHIEFAELEDSVEEIRKKYLASDGRHMELRPYVVCAPPAFLEQEKARRYGNFRRIISRLTNESFAFARGKIKELRSYLREGETAAKNYMKVNLIEDLIVESYLGVYEEADVSLIGSGQGQQYKLFVTCSDEKEHSIIFDAIECIDTFIGLEG